MQGDDVEDDELEDDDVEDNDVKGEDEDRPLGAHFAQACAVEMLFKISQEPLFTEIYRLKATDQTRGPQRACAVEMHLNISQEQLYTEICRTHCLGGKTAPNMTHTSDSRKHEGATYFILVGLFKRALLFAAWRTGHHIMMYW